MGDVGLSTFRLSLTKYVGSVDKGQTRPALCSSQERFELVARYHFFSYNMKLVVFLHTSVGR